MSTENKNMPRLRFPGFTGEWVEKPLSNFLFEHKLKSDGKCEVHSVSVSKGVINQIEYLGRSFAAADTSRYNLVKPNDIIYTKSPTGDFPYGIVKQNKNPYNVIVSPLYAVYSPVNKYVGYILDSYFESPVNTNNYLSSLIQKGAKNTIQISNDTFVSKSICLPTDEAEQQKIAECLTAIDDLIVAQGKKVDALKEHKKGLMQQLFPQPGETTPRLRFPGFTDEWVEKKLGDCFEFRQGVQCPVDLQSLQKKEGDIRFIRIIDLTQPSEPPRYIADPGFIHHISKNDLFMVRYGSPGLVGYDYEGVIANNLFRLLPKFDICTKFCKYVLTNLQKEIVELSGASTMPAVNFTTLGLLRIVFPKTLAEQQKIAECLSTLDDQIKAESAELDVLKEHKKGLMQQLFPQPTK